MQESVPYQHLSPELILDAAEKLDLRVNGSLMALNSYENRVYQLGVEDEAPVVAKFYRPGRWENAAILEEHAFARRLADNDIPVVPPLVINNQTLFEHEGYRYAFYPRRGGRAMEPGDPEQLRWMGRLLGRMHRLAAGQRFRHRPNLTPDTMGRQAQAVTLASEFIPIELLPAYQSISDHVLSQIELIFDRTGPVPNQCLHGDFHPGNILWTDQGPHFVDLDDCLNGPPIQDLWMLLSGDREEMQVQLNDLLEGYQTFNRLEPATLALIEPLRSLRLIHHSAWLCRRWSDPAFPTAFPWFASPRYWEEQITTLQEQLSLLQERPLDWPDNY